MIAFVSSLINVCHHCRNPGSMTVKDALSFLPPTISAHSIDAWLRSYKQRLRCGSGTVRFGLFDQQINIKEQCWQRGHKCRRLTVPKCVSVVPQSSRMWVVCVGVCCVRRAPGCSWVMACG